MSKNSDYEKGRRDEAEGRDSPPSMGILVGITGSLKEHENLEQRRHSYYEGKADKKRELEEEKKDGK